MRTTRVRLVTMWLALASLAVAIAPGVSVLAVGTGDEGCTPGYWKNHPGSWEEYSPTTPLSVIFSFGYPQSGDTMMQALGYGGGSGVDGARRILLRAAVASVLNAAHDGLGFPLQRNAGDPGGDGFVDDVRTLLRGTDRSAILAFASYLDGLNNSGCPLGRDTSGSDV